MYKKENNASWSDYLKKKHSKSRLDNRVQEDNPEEIVLRIGGMSCSGCEMRIRQELERLPGIDKVQLSYSKSRCTAFIREGEINPEQIIGIIKNLGYEAELLGDGAKMISNHKKKKRDSFSVKQLIGIGIIIAALFLILDKTGVFNLVPEVNESVGYGLLFVIGLLTSLHCIAMCGGINLSQSVRKKEATEKTLMEHLKPGFLYNAGRLISYTIIGGVVGLIGSFISFSGNVQGVIIIIAGSFMLILGINMLDIFPFLRKFTIRPPKVISKGVGRLIKGKGPFIVGLLNGFMPCGPLQTMQLYALGTGSFLAGSFSMFLFCLGTIPLMLGFSALGALLTRKFTHRMLKISAILVLLLGIGMIARGLNLSGINLNVTPQQTDNIATINDDNIQYIETDLSPSYYEPIIVQTGIPVKWTIKAEEESLNGCNNPMTIPKYNIRKKLVPGNNIIEFTPEKSGRITYTCWMGMITSTILVVDNISNVDREEVDEIYEAAASSSGCSGCSSGSCSIPGAGVSAEKFDLGIDSDSIGFAEIRDNIQYAIVYVNERGYSPEVLVMQRGIPTEWIFRGDALDEKNYRLEFPSYRAKLELREGENKITQFIPQVDFHYTSWKGDFAGFISVVDDVKQVNIQSVKDSVENYSPFVPSGSCCGG